MKGINRMDKKQVSFRVDPNLIKKIKFLALELDKSLTDIFVEALQDIMKKYETEAKK